MIKVNDDGLAEKLERMNSLKFSEVAEETLIQIFNRTRTSTPVKSGELRLSANFEFPTGSELGGSVGYVKEYAPHVEYGHRTKDGGYVEGQYYLRGNVEKQEPIFVRELAEAIRNA